MSYFRLESNELFGTLANSPTKAMTVKVGLLTVKLEVVKSTSFRANFAKTDILRKNCSDSEMY